MIHILKFRTVNKDIFEAVKSGKKKVEIRAITVKYQNIKPGEEVKLVCGEENFLKIVVGVKMFKNVTALLKNFNPQEINPSCHSKEELKKMFYSFPGYKEKISKYGLIALELK